jgi:hypothetical protein
MSDNMLADAAKAFVRRNTEEVQSREPSATSYTPSSSPPKLPNE